MTLRHRNRMATRRMRPVRIQFSVEQGGRRLTYFIYREPNSWRQFFRDTIRAKNSAPVRITRFRNGASTTDL